MIYPNFFMENRSIIPKGIAWPFALLTILFFAWAVPNNLTDTMLAAFKRIMSLSDSKTAWIQVVCYLLGYGCFAIPGALFIKRYTYKSGVMLGLGLYALGTFMFYPAMLVSAWSAEVGFVMFLLAIFVLFAGLSILETSTNSYVCAIGPEETATRRLNFAQSFNPFGAIAGVVISQVFILSQLNTMVASERAALPEEELVRIQGAELNAVTMTYMALGAVMVAILLAIRFTRMPRLKEGGALDFRGSLGRLLRNRNYRWSGVPCSSSVSTRWSPRWVPTPRRSGSSRRCGMWSPWRPASMPCAKASAWTPCCPARPNRPAPPIIFCRSFCSSRRVSYAPI